MTPKEDVNMGATRDIIARAMKDEAFRKNLLKDARGAVKKDLGIEFPEGVKIHVHENSPTVIHLVLPTPLEISTERTLSDPELAQVAGGLTLARQTLGCVGPTLGPTIGASPLPLSQKLSPIASATFGAYTSCCSRIV